MHYLGTLKVPVEEVMGTLLLSVCASTEYRQSKATLMPRAPEQIPEDLHHGWTWAASSGAPPHNQHVQTFAETIIFQFLQAFITLHLHIGLYIYALAYSDLGNRRYAQLRRSSAETPK
jgi:hypothetical protein